MLTWTLYQLTQRPDCLANVRCTFSDKHWFRHIMPDVTAMQYRPGYSKTWYEQGGVGSRPLYRPCWTE